MAAERIQLLPVRLPEKSTESLYLCPRTAHACVPRRCCHCPILQQRPCSASCRSHKKHGTVRTQAAHSPCPACTGAGAPSSGDAAASAAALLHEPPSRAAVGSMTSHGSGATLLHAMHAGQKSNSATCYGGRHMQQEPQQSHAGADVCSTLLETGKPDCSLGSHAVLLQLLLGACDSAQHAPACFSHLQSKSYCLQSHHCHPTCGGTFAMVHVGPVVCL